MSRNPTFEKISSQLRVLRFGFLQDGDVGIGVFPDAGPGAAFSANFLEPFSPRLRKQYESRRVELKDMTIPH
jgi:hypothetical protein